MCDYEDRHYAIDVRRRFQEEGEEGSWKSEREMIWAMEKSKSQSVTEMNSDRTDGIKGREGRYLKAQRALETGLWRWPER